MKSERELLSSLINNKLGEGRANFEKRIGGKLIDLVFEKKDEIWLVEAKRKLNFEAFGQIRTYKHLFEDKLIPSKKIKLGIVCEESDPEIEVACGRDRIEVFIFPEEENEEKRVETPICRICGKGMVEEGGEYECKTCKHYFGVSSRLEECVVLDCKRKFGNISRFTQGTLWLELSLTTSSTALKILSKRLHCCRECADKQVEPRNGFWETRIRSVADVVKEAVNQGELTPWHLERKLPKPFIQYCLGKEDVYF